MNTEMPPKPDDQEAKTKPTIEADETLNSVSAEASTIVGDVLEANVENNEISLDPDDKLGKYVIRSKLGQGGMGAVFLAFDPMIEREVAIKVLPPAVANNPQALERFLSEAKATGKLNHPNVVAIYDIGQHEDLYYIVMELLGGSSLSDVVVQKGALSWQDACRITAEAAEGLAAAHSAGLVHRDIKPENLMLTQEGAVKVVDFGLSKLTDAANDTREAVTKAGQILGTPQYMSPEQFQGKTVDARSDIYSLGGTFYRLLTGRVPYDDCASIMQVMYAHLEQPPPDPTKDVAKLPLECKQIIQRAMAKSPDDRYQDVGELAVELKSLFLGDSQSPLAVATDVPMSYTPLNSVAVVEPSRMQSLILSDAFKKASVDQVQSYRRSDEVCRAVENDVPEVLITAMQLPDSQGIDLIDRLRCKPSFQQTMFILNSSDANWDELNNVEHSGTMAIVSKKTKPEDLLRAIRVCTFWDIPQLLSEDAMLPESARSLIVSETGRIPELLAAIIREFGLIDVQIATFESLASIRDSNESFDLTLILRTAGDAANDTQIYTDLLTRMPTSSRTMAALQIDGEQITIRAVQSGGFAAVSKLPFDAKRLKRLL